MLRLDRPVVPGGILSRGGLGTIPRRATSIGTGILRRRGKQRTVGPRGGWVVVWPAQGPQDEAGRMWGALSRPRFAIRRTGDGAEARFVVHVRNDNRERTPPLVRLTSPAERTPVASDPPG